MKPLIIAAFFYFLLINTQYYWKPAIGAFGLLLVLFLLFSFIALSAALAHHLIKSIKNKFQSRQRNVLILCLIVTLGTTLYKPMGLIDFDKLQGEDAFTAQREGAANCMTTLKLKNNGILIESTFCFGSSRFNGAYSIGNDTIWFTNYNDYKFGLLSNRWNKDIIELYKSRHDQKPMWLLVTKNKL